MKRAPRILSRTLLIGALLVAIAAAGFGPAAMWGVLYGTGLFTLNLVLLMGTVQATFAAVQAEARAAPRARDDDTGAADYAAGRALAARWMIKLGLLMGGLFVGADGLKLPIEAITVAIAAPLLALLGEAFHPDD